MNLKKAYDITLIGASPLSIIEAVNQNKNGKSVLIIEKSSNIGGSWSVLNLFGYENVENAIHYFLPSEPAIKFLKEKLKLDIEEVTQKFKIFHLPIFGLITVKNKSFLSFFLGKESLEDFLKKKNSFYLKNGSFDLISASKALLDNSNVQIIKNCEINRINFLKDHVNIETSDKNKSFKSSKIIFTNSSRLNSLYIKSDKIKINEKIQLRPSLHLLVNDDKIISPRELIFINDDTIKYIHNVTRFTSKIKKSHILLIIALKHDTKNSKELYNKILKKLKRAKIFSTKAEIINSKWTDVILPRLFDEDLRELNKLIGDRLITLRTENFTRAIELNLKRWTKI